MPPVINENSEDVERIVLSEDGNEQDSGIFSEATINSNLPIYVVPHGDNLHQPSRKLGKPATHSGRRLINKNGKPNVIRTHIPQLWTAYIRDIGNTLVNSRWRWTILCFASSYLISWLLFAWFYMLIARDNNDVSEINPSTTPCLMGIEGFAGYFLFSLETQHTIGYGTRYITSNCPEGTFMISLQMIMGVAICGGMASIVYTKMVRPRAPHSKTLFSKTAIICQRDGILCLIFRVRDEDYRHRVGTKINAYLVERRAEEPFLKSLQLERPGFLLWPLQIVHQITPSSPFWDLSAKDLITKRFELVITLQGTSVTTGQCSKTRTSYSTSEIFWGHRFKPCVTFDYEKHCYYVDNNDFNATEEVMTPLCSAQRLYQVVKEMNSNMGTPFLTKSAATSRSWNPPNSDGDSLDNLSSEILNIPEELSTLTSGPTRKLSTIREWNSLENIRSVGLREQPFEVCTSVRNVEEASSFQSSIDNVDKWQPEVERYLDDIETQFPKTKSQNPTRNSGIFDVESLVTSLQNYLMQTEGAEKTNDYRETNL